MEPWSNQQMILRGAELVARGLEPVEVFLHIAVFGMEPQAAVEAPRFAT